MCIGAWYLRGNENLEYSRMSQFRLCFVPTIALVTVSLVLVSFILLDQDHRKRAIDHQNQWRQSYRQWVQYVLNWFSFGSCPLLRLQSQLRWISRLVVSTTVFLLSFSPESKKRWSTSICVLVSWSSKPHSPRSNPCSKDQGTIQRPPPKSQ